MFGARRPLRRREPRETRMSAIAVGQKQSADLRAKRPGFWRALGRQLDAWVAYPARHAVSERDLRRVDDEIERCRSLMFKAR